MTESIQCASCGSTDLDDSMEDFGPICTQCGAVVEEQNNIPQNESRQTNPGQDGESSDPVSWGEKYTVHNSTQKSVASGLEFLEELAAELSLSDESRTRAADLFGDAATKGLTDGRPMELTVAAVLYIACRNSEEPRPLVEFADKTDHTKQRVDVIARQIQRDLNLNQPICTPDQYVPFLIERLDLEYQVEQKVQRVLEKIQGTKLVNGKNPVGVAGAALYQVASDEITQREAALVTGVTEETIRVRVKDLRVMLDE